MNRTSILASVGAGVAVAALAIPLAILGARDEGPAPESPSRRVAEIPQGFPLDAGWPTDSEGGEWGLEGPNAALAPFPYSACDSDLPAPDAKALRAVWSNVEDFRTRELLAFATADHAVAFLADVAEFYAACPEQDRGEGSVSFREVRRTTAGSESLAVVHYSQWNGVPAVGMEVLHFVRVGGGVLIDTAANEGGAGPDLDGDIASQIAYQTSTSSDVLEAMCVFAEAGCG